MMAEVAQFNQYRSYLFAIAYRMLGSAMDAEDMVQETYLRWQKATRADIESPKSFLAAIITRLCIDYLRSARSQRETYIGEWLPEPLAAPVTASGDERVALAESLSFAFLVLLESLSPTERAAFLLREVFDYDYVEIAQIVDKSPTNCRQMVSRARRHIHNGRPRFQATAAETEAITLQFAQACLDGDMAGLLALLAEDVVEYSDGGGQVPSALRPIRGADHVARFILGILKKAPPGTSMTLAMVNDQPAILGFINGQLYNTVLLDVGDGRIQQIYIINNPDKLAHIKQKVTPPAGFGDDGRPPANDSA